MLAWVVMLTLSMLEVVMVGFETKTGRHVSGFSHAVGHGSLTLLGTAHGVRR